MFPCCLLQQGWSSRFHLGELLQLTLQEFSRNFGAQYDHWHRTRYLQQLQQQGLALPHEQYLQQQQQQQQWSQQRQQQQQQWSQQRQQQQQQWSQQQQQQQQQQWSQQRQQQEGLHFQQQQRLQQDVGQVDDFVLALQAKLGAGQPAAAAGGIEAAAGAPWQQQQHQQPLSPEQLEGQLQQQQWLQEQQQQQQQQQQSGYDDSIGDVYYDGVLVSAGTGSDGGYDNSSIGSSWDENQDRDYWFGEQQQQQREGPKRQQMPWLQQQQQLDPKANRKGRFLANSNQRSVNKREQATAATQLSGLELYGTWLGCLMQPAAAPGTAAASALAAGGGVGIGGGGIVAPSAEGIVFSGEIAGTAAAAGVSVGICATGGAGVPVASGGGDDVTQG
jgi:hypothetical protein